MRKLLIPVLLILTCTLSAQEEYSINNRRAIGQFEMAKRYYILRNYENAAGKLSEALDAEPEFIEAWLLLGQVQTDADKIEAEYKDGVLKVEIPRSEAHKPKEITVH